MIDSIGGASTLKAPASAGFSARGATLVDRRRGLRVSVQKTRFRAVTEICVSNVKIVRKAVGIDAAIEMSICHVFRNSLGWVGPLTWGAPVDRELMHSV